METRDKVISLLGGLGLLAVLGGWTEPEFKSGPTSIVRTIVESSARALGLSDEREYPSEKSSHPDSKGSSASQQESKQGSQGSSASKQQGSQTPGVSGGSFAGSQQSASQPQVALPDPNSRKYIEFPKTREEVSLDLLTKTLFSSSNGSHSPKLLMKGLEAAGLEPIAAQDFNPDTGKMLVVRTGESLPGTRYFHAQFFEGENKRPFLQHMSFEFQPGPDAMDRALTAIAKNFPRGLGQPTIQEEGFVSWKTKSGHVVWAKRLDAEDLKSDPFNAYTKADVGTVRVAVELDPHAHDDDH